MGENESVTVKRNAGVVPALGPFLKTSALPLWKSRISEETRQFQLLVETTEKFLSEQFNKFTEDLAATTKDMSEEEKFESFEFASGHHFSLEHDLPRILRYSLLVHACTQLESTLQGIAECLQCERKLTLSPRDLNGTGIHQARKYLMKVAQVPFPEHGACWHDIITISKIRNIVVHRNGFLVDESKENSSIEAFMKKHVACIGKDEVGRLRFTHEFVPFALARFQEFFEELFKGFGR